MQSMNVNFIQKFIPISMDDAGYPYTHWIMMGLVGNGGYSHDDDKFTAQIYDDFGKKQAEKENIRIIKERIRNMGVSGYAKFLDNKMITTWNDGTYFSPEKLCREPYYPDSFVYNHIVGNQNQIFVYISQISHILIILGIVLSGLCTYKDKEDEITFAQIAIFGNLLFLLIWETRSRYLVYFLPIMIVVSIYGYSKMYSIIKKILRNYMRITL